MDVVYILGEGSVSNDEELRYSLRSLDKHMQDLRTVYIVGKKPDFIKNFVHIPSDDPYKKKWQNMLHKVRQACEHPDISEQFLLMNDDFFLVSSFVGEEFPFYAVKGEDGGPSGRQSFMVHCPIRIQKEWFSKMPISPEMPGDFSPRTFYANFYQAPPTFTTDMIVRNGEGLPDFPTQIIGRDWFSIGNDIMLDQKFVDWLDELYPNPSRFE